MIDLFFHQWLEKVRSPFWQKSIVLNILLTVLGLYLMVNIMALSYFADKIFINAFNEITVTDMFSRILFYYFIIDIFIRFLVQQLPVLKIQPYLTLPIKKSRLLHYPLVNSIYSFFNVLGLLLILPFFIKNILPSFSTSYAIVWILSTICLIGFNNYLNFLTKKYFAKRPLIIIAFLMAIGAIIYLDIKAIFSFSHYFSTALNHIAGTPVLVAVPLLMLSAVYFADFLFLKNNSYIEDQPDNSRSKTLEFGFLDRYGKMGDLLKVELKMIYRNKRTKTILVMGFLFLFYGLIFYQDENINNYFFLLFAGLFTTSMFSISYGQFLFAWESCYFDSILSNNLSVKTYIKSKYLFITISNAICYVLTLPYALLDYKIPLINAAVVLYNIGISAIIMMYFGTYNSKRIDLGRSQMMNYQGTSAVQFLLMIPVLLIPILLYGMFSIITTPTYSFMALAVLGLLGLIFNRQLLQIVSQQFIKKRYHMAAGFRKI